MKKLYLSSILVFVSITTNGQIDPIGIIDKFTGTLLPGIVNGVKEIQESKKREKDKKAKELEDNYKKAQELAVKEAKKEILNQLDDELEYLRAVNLVQTIAGRMSNDVGRMSIFKDISFSGNLKEGEAPEAKNEIIRKFQNAWQQVYGNISSLKSQREKIDGNSISASARAAVYIGMIISKLEEINSSYDDCPNIKIGESDGENINPCFEAVKSVSNDIAILEMQVESLNMELTTMLTVYLKKLERLKAKNQDTK